MARTPGDGDQWRGNCLDRPSRRKDPTGILQALVGADYSDDERELLVAVDRYKRKHHRVYLTCREMLEIIVTLGYKKPGAGHPSPPPRNLYRCGCPSVMSSVSTPGLYRVKPLCPVHFLPLAPPTATE